VSCAADGATGHRRAHQPRSARALPLREVLVCRLNRCKGLSGGWPVDQPAGTSCRSRRGDLSAGQVRSGRAAQTETGGTPADRNDSDEHADVKSSPWNTWVPVVFQSGPAPVTWGDGQDMPFGHDDHPCPSPALPDPPPARSWLVLLGRSSASMNAELLVLRHESPCCACAVPELAYCF
jgi:hypothetical protein